MVALHDISEMPIHIDDTSHTFAAMASQVRQLPRRPDLIVIDHLHLMRTNGRHENRNNELASITRDIKLFSGEMGCSTLLLAQLNRSSEKDNRPPEMRDLRDCGAIEADADLIFFLHRRETVTTEDKKAPVPVDLVIAKQRDGVSFLKIPFVLAGAKHTFIETMEAA
jgi:replicative DNA helicase